jgi:hypothetical protein
MKTNSPLETELLRDLLMDESWCASARHTSECASRILSRRRIMRRLRIPACVALTAVAAFFLQALTLTKPSPSMASTSGTPDTFHTPEFSLEIPSPSDTALDQFRLSFVTIDSTQTCPEELLASDVSFEL